MKIYAARQPVLDSNGKLFGYEFLYRDSERNEFNREVDGGTATCMLLSNMLSEFGLENLTGGTFAFLNLTESLLRSDYVFMMDPGHFIIEILENVQMDEQLHKRLVRYREEGYIFALDDFVGGTAKDSFMDVIDILKVDFRMTDKREQRSIARRFGKTKLLLAEKIETEEEKDWAVENGYSLLQGYYFSRPVILSKAKTEIALATYIRLLREFDRPDFDFGRLADIILMDVNLSYKFLVRVNTLQFYRGNRVKTVKQSLIRMGFLEVRRWTLAILIRDVFGEKDNDSAKRALVRGVFTEKLVDLLKWEEAEEEAYMLGMFSCMDTSMKEIIAELLSQIKISQSARDALINRKGRMGELLDFVENYEQGKMEFLPQFLKKYSLEDTGISLIYFEAVKYAEVMFDTRTDCEMRGSSPLINKKSPLIELLGKRAGEQAPQS